MNNIILKNVTSDNIDFTTLCYELDSFLNIAIGGECKREKYIKYNNADTMDHVVLAYDGDTPVGCATLRKYNSASVELKRVFVRPDYRKQNIGGKLLEHLISYAKNAGYQSMILETGEFLDDSVKLYKRYGFWKTENYGSYADMPESLCMGLSLSADSVTYCLGKRLTPAQISTLFCSVNWKSGKFPNKLEAGFKNAGTLITAFHGDELIALAEAIDDGAAVAYVHYLLVHPRFQNRQIGTHMMELLKDIYSDYISLMIISETPESLPFYRRLGFDVSGTATPLHINCF